MLKFRNSSLLGFWTMNENSLSDLPEEPLLRKNASDVWLMAMTAMRRQLHTKTFKYIYVIYNVENQCKFIAYLLHCFCYFGRKTWREM